MKRIKTEKSSNQIFITPSIGIVKVVGACNYEEYINLCFAWLKFLISIRIYEKK